MSRLRVHRGLAASIPLACAIAKMCPRLSGEPLPFGLGHSQRPRMRLQNSSVAMALLMLASTVPAYCSTRRANPWEADGIYQLSPRTISAARSNSIDVSLLQPTNRKPRSIRNLAC